jgi:hypothetical protein
MKNFLLASAIFLLLGCHKDVPNYKTLKELAKTAGMISECELNGQTVYDVSLNAYDAGSTIYNADGEILGTCNYAWGSPDPICAQLSGCKIIYCIEDNIWGQSAVDVYGLK